MQRDNGSGNGTTGTASPTHGARVRHRKRSSEVMFVNLQRSEILGGLCFYDVGVADLCFNLYTLLSFRFLLM